MDTIRTGMSVLIRHEGIWEGSYCLIDNEGRTLDFHYSRVEIMLPESGPYPYIQRNHFWWPDGREIKVEHPGTYENGMLHWSTEHISGHALQVDENCCVVKWARHDTPGSYLYEIIVLGEGGVTRGRTWEWFRDGAIYQRTLINETKVG